MNCWDLLKYKRLNLNVFSEHTQGFNAAIASTSIISTLLLNSKQLTTNSLIVLVIGSDQATQ